MIQIFESSFDIGNFQSYFKFFLHIYNETKTESFLRKTAKFYQNHLSIFVIFHMHLEITNQSPCFNNHCENQKKSKKKN